MPCQSRWSWVRLSTAAASRLEARARRPAGSSTAPAQTWGGAAAHRPAPRQRVEHRRPDVAGHRDAAPAARDQLAGHRGRRRLAVGAGDASIRGAGGVRTRRAQPRERPRRRGRVRPARDARARGAAISSGAARSPGARPGLRSTRGTPSSRAASTGPLICVAPGGSAASASACGGRWRSAAASPT